MLHRSKLYGEGWQSHQPALTPPGTSQGPASPFPSIIPTPRAELPAALSPFPPCSGVRGLPGRAPSVALPAEPGDVGSSLFI